MESIKVITYYMVILLCALLSACATYQPLPLQTTVQLNHNLQQLQMDTSKHAELPGMWKNSSVNIDDGLNEVEIVQLAVLNSPHLAAVQATRKDAQAQLIQAGLLPDPQFNLSADFPRSNDPALGTAYSFGLGFDLQSLMTRSARQSAATKQARTVYLQVLWQEWQIIQQARMLYRRALIQGRQLELTHAQFLRTQTSWQVQKDALDHGNITLDNEGLVRTSMMDAQAVWFEVRRQRSSTMHSMALLLGLSPQVEIPLSPPDQGLSALIAAPLQDKDFQLILANLDQQRPDLLALQAGYQAQESRVRAQILSQFPGFTIGANSLRDTGSIWTLGPFINLNLPLLNGNRGNIALARATRARFRAEYRDRLTSAGIEASRLVVDQQLAYDELAALQDKLPDLNLLMQRMRTALAAGNVDMLIFTTLQNSHFAQHMKVMALQQALLEQQVALETLTGTLFVLPVHAKSAGNLYLQQEYQP